MNLEAVCMEHFTGSVQAQGRVRKRGRPLAGLNAETLIALVSAWEHERLVMAKRRRSRNRCLDAASSAHADTAAAEADCLRSVQSTMALLKDTHGLRLLYPDGPEGQREYEAAVDALRAKARAQLQEAINRLNGKPPLAPPRV